MEEKLKEVEREQKQNRKKLLKRKEPVRIEELDSGDDQDSDLDVEKAKLTQSTVGYRVGHAFCLLKSALSLTNLACFLIKVPFVVFVIRAVVEVLQVKARDSLTTTLEPPYGEHEGFHTDGSTTPGPKISACKLICLVFNGSC